MEGIENRFITPSFIEEDVNTEVGLRPKNLGDYVGQEKNKEKLKIFIEAAKRRGEALDHVLLYGPPGLGKTTLAGIIANEMGVNIKITSGPAIERPGDLAAILNSLKEGDVLFIDEIHRLNRIVEEVLYPAMEDFALDIVIGKGPAARSIRIDLPKFTLVGATTRSGLLTSPLRDRFGVMCNLELYSAKELHQIVLRSANILNVAILDEAAWKVASRSRGTPRIVNRILKRVRDYAEYHESDEITEKYADSALKLLEIDELGLDCADRKILNLMINKFEGGPVGLDTLAAASGEDKNTLEDVVEPFLLQLGFLNRTPRGRVVTRAALEHMKIEIK